MAKLMSKMINTESEGLSVQVEVFLKVSGLMETFKDGVEKYSMMVVTMQDSLKMDRRMGRDLTIWLIPIKYGVDLGEMINFLVSNHPDQIILGRINHKLKI